MNVISQFFLFSYDWARLNLSAASRFKLTPDSAASSANRLCNSGGTRTINRPLYFFADSGSGTGSPLACKSVTTSETTCRNLCNAISGSDASSFMTGNLLLVDGGNTTQLTGCDLAFFESERGTVFPGKDVPGGFLNM